MIAHLHGILVAKAVERVVVDVQGVGYHVFIPLSTYYILPNLHEPVTLLTTMHVREDAIRLYGFATDAERALFELLVGVSTIGPRLALNMLSSLDVADLQRAIAHGEVAKLQSIPGIGRKTAERVVLELQEKVALIAMTSAGLPSASPISAADQLANDVISALLNLGYRRGEAERAVQAVRAQDNGTETVETWLKDALQHLAR
jgi:Holliday junction DNA helicase RuvA